MQVLFWILSLLIGYFLGTFNGALLISRGLMHDDVRTHGSGNAGLTNFFRTYGGVQTLLVVVIDMLKCILACQIAAWLLPDQALYAKLAAGFACVLGHSYPVTENFRGGKGILCGSAVGLMISPKIYAIIMTVFIVVVLVTRLVSLGSILATTSFVICVFVFHWGDWPACLLALAIGSFVIARHHANIRRLLHGTESKLTFHKKK